MNPTEPDPYSKDITDSSHRINRIEDILLPRFPFYIQNSLYNKSDILIAMGILDQETKNGI